MEKEIIYFEERELPIKRNRLSMQKGGKYRGLHSHVAMEIVTVQQGQLHCYINEESILVPQGQILFINSNIGHRLTADRAEITYIHVEAGFFQEERDSAFSNLYTFISRNNAKPYMLFENNPEIEEILQKINAKYDENQAHSRWYLKAYLYELVAFMYAQSFIAPAMPPAKELKKIEQLVCYIDENFKLQLTLDAICARANYNKYALCHTFKSATGATIFDYINFLRIRFAAERLKQKNNSILEIATESGFSSATYFNRVFNNVMGCSPSVYRKMLEENNGF